MYLKPVQRIVRFGLTTAEQPSSPVWRLWVQGDETYLAVRMAIGVSKVSLHSSGYWVFTAGAERIRVNGPRHLNESWRVGPRVVFAGVSVSGSLHAIKERGAKHFFLFPSPCENEFRDFAVLFGKRSADKDELLTLLPQRSDIVGPMRLRSGDSVWLATFITRMTNEHVQYVRTQREKFKVTVRGGIELLRSPWATLVQDAENGDTMFICFPLGRENIVVSNK